MRPPPAATIRVGSSGLGVDLNGAGAGVTNTVSVDLEASVKNGSILLVRKRHADDPGLDQSEINADAGGVAIAASLSSSTAASSGTDLSGTVGVALAENTLNNSVLAYINGSDVHVPSSSLTLEAKSETAPNSDADYRVDALAFGVAATVDSGAGSSGGLSGSLTGAGSSATNNIDNTILAYITGSDGSLIQASGLLTSPPVTNRGFCSERRSM